MSKLFWTWTSTSNDRWTSRRSWAGPPAGLDGERRRFRWTCSRGGWARRGSSGYPCDHETNVTAHTQNARMLRALARRLRYQTLTAAIGRSVRVASAASVADDVLRGLGGLLPPNLVPL